MKFIITTTIHIYTHLEELKEMEELKKLGFKFENLIGRFGWTKNAYKIAPIIKEISSLEELINLTEKYGKIVLDGNEIEIYNGYRE